MKLLLSSLLAFLVGCSPSFLIHRHGGWLEADSVSQKIVLESRTDNSITILQLHNGHWWTTYVDDDLVLRRDEQLCPLELQEVMESGEWKMKLEWYDWLQKDKAREDKKALAR